MDSSKDTKKTSALLGALEKLGAIGALIAIVILVGLYFWVATTAPAKDSTLLVIARDLTLALLTGIIPVFILFVISYALFKEIDTFREDEKREYFAKTVANKVGESLQKPVADKFFSTKSDERHYISGSASELWFIQETGSLISESYRSEIISFLRRHGRIKVLVASPHDSNASLMIFRNSTLESIRSFRSRADKFIEHMREIAKSSGSNHDQIEIRYLSYPVPYTMVMVEPNSTVEDHSKALIRLAGFKVPYEEKADFSVALSNSPITFNSYRKQFESMWLYASRFTLITGRPRSGKSTLMNKLVQQSTFTTPYYAFSKEILNDENQRIGFEVITSASETSRQFAMRNSLGKYDVVSEVWDDVAAEIDAAIQNDVRLFLVDEIGPMQLSSKKFCSAIKELLELYSTSSYMTVADNSLVEPNSLGAQIKLHPRAFVIAINSDNRDAVKEHLCREITV